MKYLFSGLLMMVLVLVPGVMHAAGEATFGFDESAYTASRGELFDVVVTVDPHGEYLDTIRAVVFFDPDIVQAQSVRLVGSFDRSAPGNYRDNKSGTVSWGAFTLDTPISSQESVIAITFLAIDSGNGSISFSSESRAISGGDERIKLSALSEVSITVEKTVEVDSRVATLIAESASHPNESAWYASRDVDVSWVSVGGESAVLVYFYGFDQDPQGSATTIVEQDATSLSLSAENDGVYYLHLKGLQEDGQETEQVNLSIRMDTQNPNPIALTAQETKLLEGESAWFTFATTDETSGIAEYQIAINESAFQTQSSPLEMEDLPPGTYFFRVSALDRAGNTTYGSTSVRVYPEGTILDRPEGHETNSEIASIIAKTRESAQNLENNFREGGLVIPIVLGVFLIFAILFLVQSRRKKITR
ncbi:hypothetical protein HQ487_04300 [Candidatus Uhrbacteria bacterium]|nr:hypothetical protein [Candidatus Uhrbacteria bacterium]